MKEHNATCNYGEGCKAVAWKVSRSSPAAHLKTIAKMRTKHTANFLAGRFNINRRMDFSAKWKDFYAACDDSKANHRCALCNTSLKLLPTALYRGFDGLFFCSWEHREVFGKMLSLA